MRFSVEQEVGLFAASVASAVGDFEAPLEPSFGTWWDEHDDDLAGRLRAVGWENLWELSSHRGVVVAGAIELGRRIAPLSSIDDATLGGSLVVENRVRHARSTGVVLQAVEGKTWVIRRFTVSGGVPEPTFDGTGTCADVSLAETAEVEAERGHLWVAATIGYTAGLARSALDAALAHVSAREQFGAPLAALPVVQHRLAEAAVLADGLELLAWRALDAEAETQAGLLAWAGPAACEVVAQAVQVHGAIAFALEGGLHRQHRRARTLRAWNDALLAALPA